MKAFYNENEPYAVEWLRNLERAGHIAPGVVDPRGIQDVKAKDLEGYRQFHAFAGLGGWSYALRLAGWPDTAKVWTGSCPCQPFSQAGRRKGFADDRHLWPTWFKLIRKCRPPVIFGEQIASPDGLKWLDLVFADLERAGYAVGASDLCAAGVGAPHIRQRLYFVAVAEREQCGARRGSETVQGRAEPRRPSKQSSRCGDDGTASELGHTRSSRSGGHARAISGAEAESKSKRVVARRLAHESLASGTNGFWGRADWLPCADGKARPVEPGTFPLAHGVPARVGKLRAYGNAIVPQQAALFIRAVMPLIKRCR